MVLWNVNTIIDKSYGQNEGLPGSNGMFKVKNKIIFIFLAFMSIACSAADNTNGIGNSNSNNSFSFYRWPQESNFNASAPAFPFPIENSTNSESLSLWGPSDFPDNYERDSSDSDLFLNPTKAYDAIKDSLERDSLNSANNEDPQEIIDLTKKTAVVSYSHEYSGQANVSNKIIDPFSENSIATVNENWPQPRTCRWQGCKKLYISPKTMSDHLLNDHAKEVRTNENGGGEYTCNVCSKTIKKRYYYNHLRGHINYHSYLCKHIAHDGRTMCVRRFGSPSKKKSHQTNHDMAINQCPHCNSFFTYPKCANKHCAKFFKTNNNSVDVVPPVIDLTNTSPYPHSQEEFQCRYVIEENGNDCQESFANKEDLDEYIDDDHINVVQLSKPNPYPKTTRKLNSSNTGNTAIKRRKIKTNTPSNNSESNSVVGFPHTANLEVYRSQCENCKKEFMSTTQNRSVCYCCSSIN